MTCSLLSLSVSGTILDSCNGLEVYIGSDINGQPDPTKYSTNPNTTRYPNGENRTTRTRPDSELPNPNRTRHEVSN